MVETHRPKEACAFLLGRTSSEGFTVLKVTPASNILDSAVAFKIDPSEVFEVFDEADRIGLEVIGVFHSHPAPAEPSNIDLEYMKANPMVWLIASMLDKSIGAYYTQNKTVKKIEILP
ncbi:MAG: M67 family metallopeptidase [Nitrososphaerales archaeon]